jgi:phosphatidate cytidylyltransferase
VALSNHTVRVIVALVAIPLILVLAMAGGFYFFFLVAIVSGFALHEFYGLAKAKGAWPQMALGLLFGLCVNLVFMHDKLQNLLVGFFAGLDVTIPFPSMTQLFLILLLLFVPTILVVELFRNKGSALFNTAATVFGVCYVSLLLGCIIGVRELFIPTEFPAFHYFSVQGVALPEDVVLTIDRWGGATIMSVLASIWICDSAAFYVGRGFGKHKMFERVSPKKTWEGAVAGLVFGVASFVAAKYLVLPYLSITNAIVCGVIVGVFGQIGDLSESLLKRDAGVKDSSSLIPGHGGALDRFDSLTFVAPLIFSYLDFIVFS